MPFKNGAREWRWSTQAQLTRRVFIETSMSWAGSDTGRDRAAISERKVWSVLFSVGVAAAGCLESGSECRCVRRAEIEEAPDDGKWGPLVLPKFRQ